MRINATLVDEEVKKIIQLYFVKAGYDEVDVIENNDGSYTVSYDDYTIIDE